MTSNEPLEIRPVNNGWIVMRAYSMANDRGMVRPDHEMYVFETFAAMESFMRQHFGVREL